MFSEVLKVVPRIDRSQLNAMMASLNSRFARVAERFGKGLKAVMTGNILFFSLGFLAQLLNPLEKVEERIRSLLGRGSDIRDLADRFGTTPGSILRLQQLGSAFGIKPEAFGELLSKFADAVDKARAEIEDPTKEVSEASRAVAPFVNEPDRAKAFFQFLRGLRARGQGAGEDVFFGEMAQRQALERERRGEKLEPEERAELERLGLVRRRSGAELREADEAAVFGQAATGGLRRLIEADFIKEFARVGLPIEQGPFGAAATAPAVPTGAPATISPFAVRLPGPLRDGVAEPGAPRAPIDNVLDKLIRFEDERRRTEVKNDTRDIELSGAMLTEGVVQGIENAAEQEMQRARMQQANAGALLSAASGINQIKGLFEGVAMEVTKLVGQAGQYVPELISEVKQARQWFKEHFNFDPEWIKKNAEDILSIVVDPITDLVDSVESGFEDFVRFGDKLLDSPVIRGVRGLFGGDSKKGED